MAKFENMRFYRFMKTDDILVDTNIWLRMYGPESIAVPDGYDEPLFNILESGARIFVNSAIVSEFLNTSLRSSYHAELKKRHLGSEEFDYKIHYRPTDEFKERYRVVMGTLHDDILKHAELLSTSKDSLEKSIAECQQDVHRDHIDFNDEIIIHDALEHNFKIFTADKDYQHFPDDDLTIISKKQI